MSTIKVVDLLKSEFVVFQTEDVRRVHINCYHIRDRHFEIRVYIKAENELMFKVRFVSHLSPPTQTQLFNWVVLGEEISKEWKSKEEFIQLKELALIAMLGSEEPKTIQIGRAGAVYEEPQNNSNRKAGEVYDF